MRGAARAASREGGRRRRGKARALTSVRQMMALLGKELRQLVRDRAIFGYIVYTFTLQIIINAAGTSSELRQAPVLVHDGDRSALSRELVARLRRPYFDVAGSVSDPATSERALDRGEARMVLTLPPGLERDVVAGRTPVRLQALVDSSKVITGYLASSYAARVTESLNAELLAARLARVGVDPERLPAVENERRTVFNFAGDDRWPAAISSLLTMMTVACVLLPGAALVREKEHGTAEQLLVSPLTPLQILMPKVVSMVLVALAGTAVALFLVMKPLFGVPCRGSPALFLVLTAVYAFANAGLGVVLGTLSRTSAQLGLLIMLVVMPIVQLSGTWNTVETMPPLLRYGINASPLKYFNDVAYGVLLKGVGIDVLWRQASAIAALGVVFFGAAVVGFRRQFEVR